jgi:hypothetical protein
MVTQRMRILAAMAQAERRAWGALGRYKFLMFGYHAAQWVTLAHLVSPQPPNPFTALVIASRARDGWLSAAGLDK